MQVHPIPRQLLVWRELLCLQWSFAVYQFYQGCFSFSSQIRCNIICYTNISNHRYYLANGCNITDAISRPFHPRYKISVRPSQLLEFVTPQDDRGCQASGSGKRDLPRQSIAIRSNRNILYTCERLCLVYDIRLKFNPTIIQLQNCTYYI